MVLVSFHVIWEMTEVASHCKCSCWRSLWKSSLLAVHPVAWLRSTGYGSDALKVLPYRRAQCHFHHPLQLNLEQRKTAFLFWTDAWHWTVQFTRVMENCSVWPGCSSIMSGSWRAQWKTGKDNVHLWSERKWRQWNQHIYLFRVKNQLRPSCKS